MQLEEIRWITFFVQNVVPGLVGVLLTGLAIRTWQRVQDFYVERKYPLSGEYISKFEDARADERDSDIYQGNDTYTALAKLSQSGDTVTGISQIEYKTATAGWELTGEITDNGYLVGRYVGTNPHDQGHGTFFLYIRKNRYLEGIWAGYEDERGEINHGRYVLKPVLDVDIRPVNSQEIAQVVGLLDSMDADPATIERVRGMAATPDAQFTLVAWEQSSGDGALISTLETLDRAFGTGLTRLTNNGMQTNSNPAMMGAVVGTVVSDDPIDQFSVPPSALPAAVRCTDSICIIEYAAVIPQFRERGVGTQLIEAVIDRYEEADVICLVADPEQKAEIDGIMNLTGFETHQIDSTTVASDTEQEQLNGSVLYLMYGR